MTFGRNFVILLCKSGKRAGRIANETDKTTFRLSFDGGASDCSGSGTRLTGDLVGAAFADYDSYLILSHFKGHAMAGYGGAIKNISIGLGSSTGKNRIHTGGKSDARWTGGEQTAFLESMAEAGKAVSDYLGNGERIVYINVMNRLSIDCDCNGHPAEPDIHDIGILASRDPVALDEACVELVRDAEGSASLMNRIGNRNGLHTLEHAEEIGLGSRAYRLTNLDAPDSVPSCAIRGLSVSGNAAAVTLTATEDCALMVASYTQEGRMTDIRAETLSGDAQERTVTIEISSESPESARAFPALDLFLNDVI